MERDPTAGNERLTATTAVVLLVLLAVEGVTILSIRQLLSVHIVVGLLLIPPVVLKLASTGYRFVRYYPGDADYVAGPAPLAMRLMAPLLVVSTLTVLGTGVALLALGPAPTRCRPRAAQGELRGVVRCDERPRARLRAPASGRGPLGPARATNRPRGRLGRGRRGRGRCRLLARRPWLHRAHEQEAKAPHVTSAS